MHVSTPRSQIVRVTSEGRSTRSCIKVCSGPCSASILLDDDLDRIRGPLLLLEAVCLMASLVGDLLLQAKATHFSLAITACAQTGVGEGCTTTTSVAPFTPTSGKLPAKIAAPLKRMKVTITQLPDEESCPGLGAPQASLQGDLRRTHTWMIHSPTGSYLSKCFQRRNTNGWHHSQETKQST